MCEGKTIVAFANRYRVCSWWILTQTSPSSYLFINKLPSEVQTPRAAKDWRTGCCTSHQRRYEPPAKRKMRQKGPRTSVSRHQHSLFQPFPHPPAVWSQCLALSRNMMPSREMPRFPDQERTLERPRTRTGKRPRTKLGPASLSTRREQNSSGGGAPTAAAAPIHHEQLQRPEHQLLFVRCRDSGSQCLVDGGSAVTLRQKTGPPRNARPINITLTSASGSTIPTFGCTTRELNLGGQLFPHNFICTKVKQPILGQDSLQKTDL